MINKNNSLKFNDKFIRFIKTKLDLIKKFSALVTCNNFNFKS